MSDKKLLEEGTIRRFMELANIKPVGNGLLEEKKTPAKKPAKADKADKAEKPVKEGYAVEEETVEEMQSPGTEEVYHEEGLDEAEGEMETAAPAEGGESESVRAALEDIKNGVDKLLGMIEGAGDLGMEVEEEPEAGGEGEMPAMGDEEEMMKDEEEALAEVAEEGKYEEEGLEEKKKTKKAPEMEEEALAEELTRRVAARLVAEMKKSGGKWGSAPHGKPPKAHGKPKSPKGYKPAGQTGPKKHKA